MGHVGLVSVSVFPTHFPNPLVLLQDSKKGWKDIMEQLSKLIAHRIVSASLYWGWSPGTRVMQK